MAGNALWFLLVAIGLLGGLTALLARGGADAGYSDEQATIIAQRLLQQARSVEAAVEKLLLSGCSENEISFANPVQSGYDNPNSPSEAAGGDEHCWVFSAKGAGLSFPVIPGPSTHWLASVPTNRWLFNGNNKIMDVGTTCAAPSCSELLMITEMRDTNAKICQKINQLLGNATVPGDTDVTSGSKWTGTWPPTATQVGDEPGGELIRGTRVGCLDDTNEAHNTLYQVLIAR